MNHSRDTRTWCTLGCVRGGHTRLEDFKSHLGVASFSCVVLWVQWNDLQQISVRMRQGDQKPDLVQQEGQRLRGVVAALRRVELALHLRRLDDEPPRLVHLSLISQSGNQPMDQSTSLSVNQVSAAMFRGHVVSRPIHLFRE